MEKLVDEGLVKALGVSSFSIKQVERLWNAARIKPTNNQVLWSDLSVCSLISSTLAAAAYDQNRFECIIMLR